ATIQRLPTQAASEATIAVTVHEGIEHVGLDVVLCDHTDIFGARRPGGGLAGQLFFAVHGDFVTGDQVDEHFGLVVPLRARAVQRDLGAAAGRAAARCEVKGVVDVRLGQRGASGGVGAVLGHDIDRARSAFGYRDLDAPRIDGQDVF